jgi:D-alanine--poly(phosphoribitol) ligase subunit 1
MVNRIQHQINQNPDSTAITLGKDSWSYRELDERADQLFSLIKPFPIGSTVGLYTDNTLHMYAALWAIWKNGMHFIPLNHKFPNDRLASIVEQSQVAVIWAESRSEKRCQELASSIPFYAIDLPLTSSSKTQGDIDTSTFAYTLFTSGSTGIPKGIPVTHDNAEALIEDLVLRYPLGIQDKVLQAFELSFDVSLACIWLAWTQGANLVVADLNGITAVNAFKAIHDHQVNFVTLPPSALYYLRRLRLLKMAQPWVTTTLFTGEALSWNVANEWRTCAMNSTVDNAYGPTETTVWTLIDRLDDHSDDEGINGLTPIGYPLKNTLIKLVDAQGNEVKVGEKGELLLGGNQVFHGYVNNPEKTSEVLFKDELGIRWYRSGDIVVQNEYGRIVYINRKDNQVQVNGFRVELGEVEHALRKIVMHDGVVVIAHESEGITELYAFIEGEEMESTLDTMKLNVPGYMVPRYMNYVKSLPINTSGKVDKAALRNNYILKQ